MGDAFEGEMEGRRTNLGSPNEKRAGDAMPLSPFVFGGDDDDEDDDELRDMEAWTRSIARRAFCPFCSSLSAAPHRRPSHTIQPTQEEIDTVEEDLELHGQDELIVKALASGGEELRQYTRQIEGDLRMVERESIGDYVQESENLANLHMQIRGCDEVLGKMEASLGSFQHELGKVSSEIQSLQARSSGLNVRAENRKNVEAGLARYIDGAAVSPALIHAVTESEVSEAYMAFVLQLRRKCEFVETDSAKAVLSTASVAPVLEKLRVKATERIRIFLLTKIAALGRPKTNFQIIQQSVLLKLSNLMAFLLQHAPEVYEEVSGRYVETMGRIYLHHIKAHLRHLARCQAECVSAADTLVQSEDAVPAASPRATVTALFASAAPAGAAFSISGMSSMLGLGPSSPAPGGPGAATRSRDSALAVGARAVVLEGDGADVLLKLAADLGTKHAPEYTFKGLLAVLLSAAASEGAFAARFLGGDSGALRAVFRPAFAAVEESVQLQVAESHDAIGLLLMIGVARRLAQGLTQSGCETLSPLFDALNMILWPRFKALLDLHVTSVKSAAPASLVASSAEKYPHTITRRFAELSASLLLLRDASSAEMLDHSLTYMRGEVMALLSRMAATLPDERLQLVFRINQVDAMIGTYNERGVLSRAAPFFQQRLDADVSALVELELRARYGGLVRCVLSVEEQAERARQDSDFAVHPPPPKPQSCSGAGREPAGFDRINPWLIAGVRVLRRPGVCQAPSVPLADVQPLAEQFAASWREAIRETNLAVMGNFHNMKNGMEILKRTLTQLLLYYTRFVDLVKKYCPESGALAPSLVHIPSIIAEIKQYSRTF